MSDVWGNMIIEQLEDYTAIDLETTGLSPEWDAIIEVSAIRLRNHEPVAHFTELVNPDRPIDSFITELTGITNEMVSGARMIEKVMPEFLEFMPSVL